MEPNNPAIIAKLKNTFATKMQQVAASYCDICNRIMHSFRVSEIEYSEWNNVLINAGSKYEEFVCDNILTNLKVCGTCKFTIESGKVPTMAVVNGFSYPTTPPDLPPLTEVEEHILALRLPFQQITNLGKMGKLGQYGLKGSVINIPIEPSRNVANVIPLLPDEDQLYIVNLKRKLVHKRSYASSFVCKSTLEKWCKFLVNTELYMKHEVKFDNARLETIPECVDDEELGVFNNQPQYTILMPDLMTVQSNNSDALTNTIDFAPGENVEPLSVVLDREAEELSFPTVYLGNPRKFKVPVTRFEAMKSEIRRVDRRGAKPQSLLYKYAVHCREQACSRLRHKFRRRAIAEKGGNFTKADLMDPSFTMCSQRKGLAIPNLLPNSAQYWKSIGHDVFAMVRQLGRPTIFLTVSAAEYHWPILLNTLQRLSNNDDFCISSLVNEMVGKVHKELSVQSGEKQLMKNDLGSLISSEERLKLIRDDPVVCAMYFKQVIDELKTYLKMENGPMGMYPVIDFVFRIEFQVRGSPHLHALLWLKNAPVDPFENIPETVKFIDSLISCDSTLPNAEKNFHKHTSTCFKKKSVLNRFYKKELTEEDMHRYCRFGIPYWPSPETTMLLPLYQSDKDKLTLIHYKSWQEHYTSLKSSLNTDIEKSDPEWFDYLTLLKTMRHKLKDVLVSENCPEQFQAFLQLGECPDMETYLIIIRASIIRPFVLYKRNMADTRTNPSMPWVGEIIMDNNDAQFITDIPSLIRYCVSYMTKGEKAHSELYKLLLRLRREKDYDDKELLYRISSEALRSKETSAQEAAWVLLKFPMSQKSRMCQFIDTSQLSDRTRCPKLMRDLENLLPESTDIWKPDVFDKYSERPKCLEDKSLAEFVAKYYNCKRNPKPNGEPEGRTKNRVIRYRKFKSTSEDSIQRENFYRGMITLHMPWFNEVNDILKPVEELSQFSSFEHMYNEKIDVIMQGRRIFECNVDVELEMEKEVDKCVAEDEKEEEEETECNELIRRYVCGHSKYIFEEVEYMDSESQNINIDIPRNEYTSRRQVCAIRSRAEWTRDELNRVVRTLNKEQRLIVLTIIHELRLRLEPRLIYIGGSAGVGKSVVARCLANSFEMFSPNVNSGYAKCVVSAPTGKAADNIDGRTIHNVYMLLVNQNRRSAAGKLLKKCDQDNIVFDTLSPESLAELQNQFSDMNAQIIDEISMVSQSQLLLIEQRCQQATGKKGCLFGGLWTIVFGDFRQLPPIGGESLMEKSESSLVGAFPLWSKFEHIELTQNMRQGEDSVFAEILRKIGDYEVLSNEERLLIESRFVKLNNLEVPKDAVRIYRTNYEVDRYSKSILMDNDSSKILILEARDRIEQISGKMQCVPNSVKVKANDRNADIFSSAKALTTTEARGLPFELIAVVGYSYLVTKNIDTSDGLVNGAVGKLVWVEFGTIKKRVISNDTVTEEVVPKRLWMKFPGRTGRMANKKYQHELRFAINNAHVYKDKVLPYELSDIPTEADIQCLVPIEREDLVMDSVFTESWRCVKRQQFPMTSALAMTVFKIQGSTKDSVYTYYDPNMSNAEVYVSFTRVTKLSGLFIDDTNVTCDEEGHYFQHPPRLTDEVEEKLLYKDLKRFKNRKHTKERYLAEKERLRLKSIIAPWQGALEVVSCEKPKFLYHNVQSLKSHVNDIIADEVFMECDLLLLAETHLLDSEVVTLPGGFVEVTRCNSFSSRRRGGVAIYSKIPCIAIPCFESEKMEVAVINVHNSLKAAVVYCHNEISCEDVINCLENIVLMEPKDLPTVICGDFNVQMKAIVDHKCFEKLYSKTQLTLKNCYEENTTYCDYGEGSCIDGVFSNIQNLEIKTYQSYFSYHLPLVFYVNM